MPIQILAHVGSLDASAVKDLLAAMNQQPTHLTGSADAVPPVLSGLFAIDTAGVDAITLATPASGDQVSGQGDDGKELTFIDTGGHAHTITTASNKIVPSHHVLTFNGTAGSFVCLQAISGLWYVTASSGVTAS